MKAMILAAGLGTRLRPLTDTTPKPLLPIQGHPLIHFTLALLKKHGITDVVINLHYLGEQIRNELGDGKKLGFSIAYSNEPEILGTGGGIMKAKPYFESEADFVVVNADVITDLDLGELIQRHRDTQALATLALQDASSGEDFGLLHADTQTSKLVSILEDPPAGTRTRAGFFLGLHVISRALLDWPMPQPQSCIVRNAYIPILKSGKTLSAYFSDAYWNDLGTPERLEQTRAELDIANLSYENILKSF